ncbi:MAG TPA: hypothetical protein ENH15_03960 [Actinobacteria bacterium]|nr:hypothetical protein [Actinomycetota bacterium]
MHHCVAADRAGAGPADRRPRSAGREATGDSGSRGGRPAGRSRVGDAAGGQIDPCGAASRGPFGSEPAERPLVATGWRAEGGQAVDAAFL